MEKDKQVSNEEEAKTSEDISQEVNQEIAGEEEAGDSKDQEIEELKDRVLRLQAEFDNFRRRTRTESEQLGSFISAEIIRKFLPVLDNFGRALQSDNSQDVENLKKGMELIYRQMEKTVADAGAEKIPALGEQFSPELHEALMNSQNPELPDGQIDMVLEEGYKYKDRVIRPSKVRVVSNS